MTDLGTYLQGQELPLTLRAVGAGGLPDLPRDNPVVSIYGPSGIVAARVRMACDLQGVETGFFRLPLPLGAPFGTTGTYTVIFSWMDSVGNARAATGTFILLPGGAADGAVIGLRSVRRPNAIYLMRQTDSGGLARGKNPR